MYVDILSEGDEADDSVLGEQGKGFDDMVFCGLKLILSCANVENEKEDRGRGWLALEGIFDSGEVGNEFCGKVRLGDVSVICGECVAMVAEWAEPHAGAEIDAAVWVEGGCAGLALNGIVGKRRRKTIGTETFQWGVRASKGNDATSGV